MVDTKYRTGGTELCPECQKLANWNGWFQKYICTECGWGGRITKLAEPGESSCTGCEHSDSYLPTAPCHNCSRLNPKPDNFKPKR